MRCSVLALRQSGWRRWAPVLVSALILAVSVPVSGAETVQATQASTVSLAALPAEARRTYRTIQSGGPFTYLKDGTVFGNRERLLPSHARGYYREYTVPTPGSRDRGARRIVCGGLQPPSPEACYYTDDHYASFRLLAP